NRSGRGAGRGGAWAAIAIGRGLEDPQQMAFIGLDDRVSLARRAADVDPVAGPLIAGDRRIAVVEGAVDRGPHLPFLGGAAERARCLHGALAVGNRGGRGAGRGGAWAAIAIGRGLEDPQQMAFIGLDDRVSLARRAADVDPVAGPLIAGDRRIAVVE